MSRAETWTYKHILSPLVSNVMEAIDQIWLKPEKNEWILFQPCKSLYNFVLYQWYIIKLYN